MLTVLAVFAVTALRRSPDPPHMEIDAAPIPLPTPPQVPEVSLAEFEGMLASARGRAVIVNVWASWCAPCRSEMPLLQKSSDASASRALVLGVAANDDSASARAFASTLGIRYPNVIDASGAIKTRLRVTAFPTTFAFSPNGILKTKASGVLSEQRLAALIEDAAR